MYTYILYYITYIATRCRHRAVAKFQRCSSTHSEHTHTHTHTHTYTHTHTHTQGGFDTGARRMGSDTLRAHGHPGSGTDRARGAESNYAPVRAGPIPSTGSGSSFAAQQVILFLGPYTYMRMYIYANVCVYTYIYHVLEHVLCSKSMRRRERGGGNERDRARCV